MMKLGVSRKQSNHSFHFKVMHYLNKLMKPVVCLYKANHLCGKIKQLQSLNQVSPEIGSRNSGNVVVDEFLSFVLWTENSGLTFFKKIPQTTITKLFTSQSEVSLPYTASQGRHHKESKQEHQWCLKRTICPPTLTKKIPPK